MADDGNDLARVLRVADERSSRSQLYRWMRLHHDDLAKTLGKVRPNWPALAAEFAVLGIMDSTGSPASPERTRKTWWRVRTDVQRAQGRRALGVEGGTRAPPPASMAAAPATPSPQASGLAVRRPTPAPAPARKPFDLEEGTDDPPPPFTFKPVRPR